MCSIATRGSSLLTVSGRRFLLLRFANTSQERYVKTIVNRYKNSPNIFAWELMNEARCLGDLPGGPACVPGSGLLSRWYKQQAAFVRKLYAQAFFEALRSTDYSPVTPITLSLRVVKVISTGRNLLDIG